MGFSISATTRRRAAAAAAVVHVLGAVSLAFLGISLWRMYCEGFGCIGKGIAWFAWSMAYLVTLAIGSVAARAHRGSGRRVVRSVLALQVAAGLVLVAVWGVRSAG